MNGDETGAPLPEVTKQFVTFGYAWRGVWKCPQCGTYYAYESEHDNGIPDGWDSEYLTRIDRTTALEMLRAMEAEPRIAQEITRLTARNALDAAMDAPGRKVFVSGDPEADGRRALVIYRIADGVKHLAGCSLPQTEHDALVADLKARGLEVGETDFDSNCDLVWIRHGARIEVYDGFGKELDVNGDVATLSDGSVIQRTEVARVIAWASRDYTYRGIKAILRSGKEVDLVVDYSVSAELAYMCYSRNELLYETAWCSMLGHAIAKWAGTELENLI